MANILREANGGAKKTHIMYKCNLSFKQLHAYLDFLMGLGLLKTETKGDSTLFKTTRKGQAFVRAYRNLRAILVT